MPPRSNSPICERSLDLTLIEIGRRDIPQCSPKHSFTQMFYRTCSGGQRPRADRALQLAEKLLQEAEILEREAERLDSLNEGAVALPVMPGEATGQSRQAEWMKCQLDRRLWTTGDLSRHGKLDRKTGDKAISGLYVSPGSWESIVDRLNQKPLEGHKIDIKEVPRTEKAPRRAPKRGATSTLPETS